MTRQPHLFDPVTATIRGGRPGLFDAQPVVARGVTCDCGADLIETESYLICPRCLGRLVPDTERSGACFPDDLED